MSPHRHQAGTGSRSCSHAHLLLTDHFHIVSETHSERGALFARACKIPAEQNCQRCMVAASPLAEQEYKQGQVWLL